MPDLQPYIAPVFALLGTVTAAGLGLYQWRRQHGNPNRGAIAEARRKAAEAIWAKLEELNLELRSTGETRRTDRRLLAADLNATFLRNSFYLDGDTQRLANDYLESLVALARQMDGADDRTREEWSATIVDPEPGMAHGELLAALTKLAARPEKVQRALLRAAGSPP